MKNILFLHGAADLYGSGKVLVSTIGGLNRSTTKSVVILPYDGPLRLLFENVGARVIIGPLGVLRRKALSPIGILKLFKDIFRSVIFIRKIDKEYGFDGIYTNTGAVLGGAVYSCLYHKKHIWHIHEIITKPYFIKVLMPRFISFSCDICVSASEATKRVLVMNGGSEAKMVVALNGIRGLRLSDNKDINIHKSRLVVGMVGRVNWWKGQEILVRAAKQLLDDGVDVDFLIVGGVFPGQEECLRQLKELIRSLDVGHRVKIVDFTANIADIYLLFDIAVIPSTQPDPLPLVALEAMSVGLPVVASNIGGLPEMVLDGKTGITFRAGCVEELKIALERLIKDADLRRLMGRAGFKRQQELFTEEQYQKVIADVIYDVF